MEPLACPESLEPESGGSLETAVVQWPAAAAIPGAEVGIGDPQ